MMGLSKCCEERKVYEESKGPKARQIKNMSNTILKKGIAPSDVVRGGPSVRAGIWR